MKRVYLGILASSVLVGACGGGDDPFGVSGPDPVSDSFPITSDNGVNVARLSYEAALSSGGFAEIGDLPVAAAPDDGSALPYIAPIGEDLMLDVISMIPFGPEEFECFADGSYFLSGDIADPFSPNPTPGDTYRIEYVNCNDSESVINGVMDMTITDFSGDFALGTYMLAVDAVVTSLSIVTADDTYTGDGDTTITVDTTDAPFVSTSVSGTTMSESSNAGSRTLDNYGSTTTLDGNQVPEEFTMTAYGTLGSSELPAVVDYTTPTVFRGFVPAYPHEGELLAEGDNSTARLIVLDAEMVRVEIDDNADGVVDYSEDMTWDAFLGNDVT